MPAAGFAARRPGAARRAGRRRSGRRAFHPLPASDLVPAALGSLLVLALGAWLVEPLRGANGNPDRGRRARRRSPGPLTSWLSSPAPSPATGSSAGSTAARPTMPADDVRRLGPVLADLPAIVDRRGDRPGRRHGRGSARGRQRSSPRSASSLDVRLSIGLNQPLGGPDRPRCRSPRLDAGLLPVPDAPALPRRLAGCRSAPSTWPSLGPHCILAAPLVALAAFVTRACRARRRRSGDAGRLARGALRHARSCGPPRTPAARRCALPTSTVAPQLVERPARRDVARRPAGGARSESASSRIRFRSMTAVCWSRGDHRLGQVRLRSRDSAGADSSLVAVPRSLLPQAPFDDARRDDPAADR